MSMNRYTGCDAEYLNARYATQVSFNDAFKGPKRLKPAEHAAAIEQDPKSFYARFWTRQDEQDRRDRAHMAAVMAKREADRQAHATRQAEAEIKLVEQNETDRRAGIMRTPAVVSSQAAKQYAQAIRSDWTGDLDRKVESILEARVAKAAEAKAAEALQAAHDKLAEDGQLVAAWAVEREMV